MSNNKLSILVVRNDKMGDLMLTWPALSWLRKNLPEAKISLLVSKNLREIAKLCHHVNDVICDDKLKNLKDILSSYHFDASISLFSTFRIAYLLKKINIPIRMAPKTKIAQFFYNHTIRQNRSKSLKPEYEYNVDLINEFFKIINLENVEDIEEPPYLKIQNEDHSKIKNDFIKKYNLMDDKKIIFINPCTGGSSKTLTKSDWIRICEGLRGFDNYNFVLHYAKNQQDLCEDIFKSVSKKVSLIKIIPTTNLIEMSKNISASDVFISGSTGPLHVAGALNKKTVGFYPSKVSSTMLRWQTINSFANRLDFVDTGKARRSITIDMNKTILEIQKHIHKSEVI